MPHKKISQDKLDLIIQYFEKTKLKEALLK